MQRQWEHYWSWFQYIVLHGFFFLALLLVTLLESSSEISPPTFICSHSQHPEGVFMWLVMQLCLVKARTCLWPMRKLRGKLMDAFLDAGRERDPQGWQPAVRERCQPHSQAVPCTWGWTEVEHEPFVFKSQLLFSLLIFGEVSSADELNWEKKVKSSGSRPQPLWKR